MFGGGEWPSPPHLQDAYGFASDGQANHRLSHEVIPGDQGPGHRRLLELPRQQKDSSVYAQAQDRLENVSVRFGPGAGVSQDHRMLPVSVRLTRGARSPQ